MQWGKLYFYVDLFKKYLQSEPINGNGKREEKVKNRKQKQKEKWRNEIQEENNWGKEDN